MFIFRVIVRENILIVAINILAIVIMFSLHQYHKVKENLTMVQKHGRYKS